MKQFFYKSQQTAVGAVLLTVLLVLVMPESARARLKSAIGGLFLPLIGISTENLQFGSPAKTTQEVKGPTSETRPTKLPLTEMTG